MRKHGEELFALPHLPADLLLGLHAIGDVSDKPAKLVVVLHLIGGDCQFSRKFMTVLMQS